MPTINQTRQFGSFWAVDQISLTIYAGNGGRFYAALCRDGQGFFVNGGAMGLDT
ncbi:hypothetical protein P8936_06565 [Edaphobacter paludis]|uniref:Uncharacterized protein n=1 Tax=Edaphobacter paludis TaxID=3035702 RepID=A0AAU7DB06_9BACT